MYTQKLHWFIRFEWMWIRQRVCATATTTTATLLAIPYRMVVGKHRHEICGKQRCEKYFHEIIKLNFGVAFCMVKSAIFCAHSIPTFAIAENFNVKNTLFFFFFPAFIQEAKSRRRKNQTKNASQSEWWHCFRQTISEFTCFMHRYSKKCYRLKQLVT